MNIEIIKVAFEIVCVVCTFVGAMTLWEKAVDKLLDVIFGKRNKRMNEIRIKKFIEEYESIREGIGA